MNDLETLHRDRSKWQVAPRNHAVSNPVLPKELGVIPSNDRSERKKFLEEERTTEQYKLAKEHAETLVFPSPIKPLLPENTWYLSKPDETNVDVVLTSILEKFHGPVSTITREDLLKRSIRVEREEWNSIKRDKLRNWIADPERESPNIGSGKLKRVNYVDLLKLKPGTIIGWQGRRPTTYYSVKKVNDEIVKVWQVGISSGFEGRLEDISVWGPALENNGSRQLDVYSGMVIESGFLGTVTSISMPYFLKTEGGGVLPPNDYWVDIVKNLTIKEPSL